MQSKRKKRTRIRAAKNTAGHGHKKKNRGAGHRGGRGKSGTGKRGDFKLMKITKGVRTMGKHGFKTNNPKIKTINLHELQSRLSTLLSKNLISLSKDIYEINLTKLGYDKLLSKGNVSVKLNITVEIATQNAIERVKKAGGQVITAENV